MTARQLRAGIRNRNQVTEGMDKQIEECQEYLKDELSKDD